MSISEAYFIDNLKYMKMVNDNYFDLVIADPPYGINAPNNKNGSHPTRKNGPSTSTTEKLKGRLNSGSGKLKNRILNQSNFDWDNEPPSQKYFDELFRISKHQIIFGYNYFNLPPTRGIFVWDKIQPWDNFSQIELAYTSFDRVAKLFRLSNTGGFNALKKIHPTEKPVKLYIEILKTYALPGFKIFDPNMGSQNSRIACYKLGYDYWGCENNKVHFDDGNANFLNFKNTQSNILQNINQLKLSI